ncbi:hypothetical protein CBR_g11109 [Chara braunii]|uniref:Uncharacterized protein n=1 Tax=Chara braunii TaxID=69332 RepID=A0A388KQ55_CHABU|nr:hypothetical protein CBR_g11109 [Chara braunii]|eukprot:GBG72176.1 hypothetical protein CBR_g11109 [Chara braunii]
MGKIRSPLSGNFVEAPGALPFLRRAPAPAAAVGLLLAVYEIPVLASSAVYEIPVQAFSCVCAIPCIWARIDERGASTWRC